MTLQTLDGIITRIVYHRPSKYDPSGTPFLIARLHNGATIKGSMWDPVEGEAIRLWGDWKTQKSYDEPAFEFLHHEAIVEQTVDGITQYLAAHVYGLGRVKAGGIVAHFGDETLTILRTEPGRASEVPGIGEIIARSIREHFERNILIDPYAYVALIDLLKDLRVPRSLIETLVKDWGSDAPTVIRETPYLLLDYPRMGWKTVDAFALTVVGYAPDGVDRHAAAIVEALKRLAAQGHTYGVKPEIEVEAFALLDGLPKVEAWEAVVEREDVALDNFDPLGDVAEWLVDPETQYALPDLLAAEREIARRLAMLAESARPLAWPLGGAGLNADQRAALDLISEHGVAILAGAPGVGKSYVCSRMIANLIERGITSIRVVTPTGKAAKRAAELLASAGIPEGLIPCTTIHRALGVGPNVAPAGVPKDSAKRGRGREPFGFHHNEHDPLPVKWLIADECSMIDVRLMAALLKALAPGTRVIFVGDHNQLPSVGPGSVLRDLMAADVPTALLSKIQRSDGGGRVVKACHAIKDGKVPEPAERLALPTENWTHIEESDPDEIARRIVDLHGPNKYGLDPTWSMQVVSAQKQKLPFACENLNDLLSEKLNQRPKAAADEPGHRPPFRVGDKIIRKKNGIVDELRAADRQAESYDSWAWGGKRWEFDETYVVNGDMGEVLDVVSDHKGTWVVVKFNTPDRLCRLPYGDCHLIQAYAITVHSAQGSGFPLTIVPVHEHFYWDQKTNTGLFNRELVYTAISRAEQMLITVGSFAALRTAIGRKTVNRRNTTLAGRIRELMELSDDGQADGRQGAVHSSDRLARAEAL